MVPRNVFPLIGQWHSVEITDIFLRPVFNLPLEGYFVKSTERILPETIDLFREMLNNSV